MIKRLLVLAWSLLLTVPAFAFQPPAGQSEFVPLNELPPNEQLPAAPLLVTAYAVFLVLMVFYVWTVWRRLNRVETEMRALEQKLPRGSR
jgi:hypothetical protein